MVRGTTFRPAHSLKSPCTATWSNWKLEASEEAFEEEEEEDSNLEFAALPKGLKDTVAKQKPKVEDTVAKQKPKKVGNRKEKQKPEVPARSSPRRKKMEEELLEILEANE